jgi:hypothetical protein
MVLTVPRKRGPKMHGLRFKRLWRLWQQRLPSSPNRRTGGMLSMCHSVCPGVCPWTTMTVCTKQQEQQEEEKEQQQEQKLLNCLLSPPQPWRQ